MSPKTKVAPEAVAFMSLLNICDRFHSLPKPGGIFDQDKLFIYLVDKVIYFEAVRRELDEAKANRESAKLRS